MAPKLPDSNTPTENRLNAVAKHEHTVKRIQDELDRSIKMAAWMREALENELFSGMGYKQLGVAATDMKRMKELALILDTLTSAKIRFDKAAKQMADSMTLAEEKAAIIVAIKAMLPGDRWDVINAVKDWMAERPHATDATKSKATGS